MKHSRIERLNQIGIALSSETNLDRLLSLIVTEARAFTRADAGSLYTLEGDTLFFRVAQNDTLDGKGPSAQFNPVPVPLDTGSIAGYVALTGEVLHIDDVYHLPPDVPFSFNADYDKTSGYRTRSMLVAPMKDAQGQVLGVLQLINSLDPDGKVRPFSTKYASLNLSLASQAAVAIKNARLIAYIKGLFEALIRYSASAIDARSPHTAGHSRRVAAYSLAIAQGINQKTDGPFAEVHFSEEELERLGYAAWLHDIGKIGVPENILDKRWRLPVGREEVLKNRFQLAGVCRMMEAYREGASEEALAAAKADCEQLERDAEHLLKINAGNWLSDEDREFLEGLAQKTFTDASGNPRPLVTGEEAVYLSIAKGNLTGEEYAAMQGHVTMTRKIVENIPFTGHLEQVPDIAASHHEMLDGTGYPRKLVGDAIPLEARILAMVDIFDALTASDRPYRKAMPKEKACGILTAEAGNGRLDPDVVELFVSEKLYDRVEDLHEDPFGHRHEAGS